VRPALLDPLYHAEQFKGLDVSNGLRTEPGEDIELEPPDDLVAVSRRPRRRMLAEPLARDGLERVARRRCLGCRVLTLALLGRIDAVLELTADVIEVLTRFLEADVGIDAERQTLLLAIEAIFEAPPAPPPRRDLEVQTAAVEEPIWLHAWLRVDDRDVGDRHEFRSSDGLEGGFPAPPRSCP